MCYSAAPSTTNQNATQRIYIKDIKWLGKSLQAYNIKMQYEIVIKVIGGVHVTLAFLKSSPAAQTAQKMAPGTGTDASPVAQRLLTNTWPEQCTTISIQANTNKI